MTLLVNRICIVENVDCTVSLRHQLLPLRLPPWASSVQHRQADRVRQASTHFTSSKPQHGGRGCHLLVSSVRVEGLGPCRSPQFPNWWFCDTVRWLSFGVSW